MKALATIAGHYRDHDGDIEWLGEDGFKARLANGEAAKAKYEAGGEVAYVKASDPVDTNVGMPGDFVFDWYGPWAARGQWENRYAVISDADLLHYESISAAEMMVTPWLMIHGDNCFLPSAARRHMAAAPADLSTRTIWDDTPHLAYYDQPEAIDRATAEVTDWFKRQAARLKFFRRAGRLGSGRPFAYFSGRRDSPRKILQHLRNSVQSSPSRSWHTLLVSRAQRLTSHQVGEGHDPDCKNRRLARRIGRRGC